jgi:signal peptidase I
MIVAALHRAGRWASGAALLAGVAVALLVLLPALLGWERYVIVSGSMTGSYDRGSLVLADVVPVDDLKVGDVITYMPPAGDHLITHRIAWVGRDQAGSRLFRTKGDANPVADPWTFRLDQPTQARVRVKDVGAADEMDFLTTGGTRLNLVLGAADLKLNANFVPSDAEFNATMSQSGAAITITLGTKISGTLATAGAGTMTWRPSSAATDLSGNASGTATVTESGVSDVAF